ncbi:MAG TPA: response regulator [Pyrinomonadaceae bacterium]
MSATPYKAKRTESVHRNYVRRTRVSPKPTVVIAEDHDDTREMLGMLYRTWGCRVVEARNGLEAVDAASREHPALILMDGSLPYLDGLGATRRIRKNRLLGDVKIIALNGWATPKYTLDALAAGCDDCLVKPLDFHRLWDQMNDLRKHLGTERYPRV